MKFTSDDYNKLNQIFTGGDISSCSQKELEKFAVMLSRPRANEYFPVSGFPQICETVRTLILVRISEKSNKEATKISTIALRIAIVALVLAAIQTFATLYILCTSDKPTKPLQKTEYIKQTTIVSETKPALTQNSQTEEDLQKKILKEKISSQPLNRSINK